MQAVVAMALARSMSTTAEGVETEAQRKMLRELGCTQMQGFLCTPAVPTRRLKELLGQGAPGCLTWHEPMSSDNTGRFMADKVDA